MIKLNKKIIIFGLVGLLICVVVLGMIFKTSIPKKIASFSASILGLSEEETVMIPEEFVIYQDYIETIGGKPRISDVGIIEATVISVSKTSICPYSEEEECSIEPYPKHTGVVRIDRIIDYSPYSEQDAEQSLEQPGGGLPEQESTTSGYKGQDLPTPKLHEYESLQEGQEIPTNFLLTVSPAKVRYITIPKGIGSKEMAQVFSEVSPEQDIGQTIGLEEKVFKPILKDGDYFVFTTKVFYPEAEQQKPAPEFTEKILSGLEVGDELIAEIHYDGTLYVEEYNVPLCKPLYQNHNSISGKRFNFVFEGVKFQDTDEFLEIIRNFIDLGSVDYKPGLFGQEPFKSNKDLFNFWYIDPINDCDDNNKDCNQKAVEYYNSCDVEHKYYFRFFHKDSVDWHPYLGVPNQDELWIWSFQPRTSTFASLPRSRYYLLHEFGHAFNSKKLDQQYVNMLLDEYYYGKNMFEYPDDYNYDYILRKGPMAGKILPNIFIDEDIRTIEECKQNAIWKDLIGDGCGEDGVIDCIQKYTTPNKDPIQYERIWCKPDKDPDCYKEISCFEGGLLFGRGIFRPSFESIMRSFGTLEYGYNLASQRHLCKTIEAELNRSEGVCVKLLKGKGKCTDSDGGKDYYKKGYVTYEGYVLNSKLIKDCDKCAVNKYTGENVLQEKYCASEGGIGTIDYTCPHGCEDGACIKGEITDVKLLRAEGELEVYYLTESGMVRHIPSPEAFLSHGFKWEDIIVSQTELDNYSINDLIRLENGIKVYKLEKGQKRWIKTAEVFNRLEYDWNKIVPANQTELDYYPEGALIE